MTRKPRISEFFDRRPALAVALWCALGFGSITLVFWRGLGPALRAQGREAQCRKMCQPQAAAVFDGECMCQQPDHSWRSFKEPSN